MQIIHSQEKTRIGILGSAFDPPTLGHLDVLQQFARIFDLILLVPSASHAFNKRSLPYSVRLEMLEVFVQSAKIDCVLQVCDLEAELLRENPDKPVYTFDLLEALEKHYEGQVELTFIRGPDNADPVTWQRFYRAEDIERRWSVVTSEERLNVRSSKVRTLLQSADETDTISESLKEMLLPSVRAYIQEHKLYQSDLL